MTIRTTLQRAIRPSTTRGTGWLLAKSLLNALLFFGIFMVALPWGAHRLLPTPLPLPAALRVWLAGVIAFLGIAAWLVCLEAFSRRGRGTPLPADAPRELVTTGLFARIRNPIMLAELAVIWAETLYLGSLGVLLYAIAISALAHWLVVHVEEPELRRRFGDSYVEYCRDVPRWWPMLGRRGGSEPQP